MNRVGTKSALDRLIALATDDVKPAAPAPPAPEPAAPAAAPTAAEEKHHIEPMPAAAELNLRGLEEHPVFRALVQFRSLIPYISRALNDMHDRVDPSVSATAEIRHGITELQSAHRELRLAAQDQVTQMRRLEEELKRSREAAESHALDNSELVEDVKSTKVTLRVVIGIVAALGLANLALVVWLV